MEKRPARAGGTPLRLVVTWQSSEMAGEEDLQQGKLRLPPLSSAGGVGSGGRKVREEGEGDEGDFQKQRDVVSASSMTGLSPIGTGLRPSTALLGAGSQWAA